MKLFLASFILFVMGCGNQADLVINLDLKSEFAQQVGENLSSIDESGGSSNGDIAFLNSSKMLVGYEKSFLRTNPSSRRVAFFWETAEAAACQAINFSSCSIAKQKIKDFDKCSTVAGGSIEGAVTLTFSKATCTIPAINDTVNRVPQFTITGSNRSKYQVSTLSTGQTVTRTGLGAGTFSFANSGINRKITQPSGAVALNIDVSTTTPIVFIGSTRTTRSIANGSGPIHLVDNLTSLSCNLTPNNVSWTTSCNCPTQGSWSGTCSDSSTFTMAFSTVCGETTVIKGSESAVVKLDHCQM